jgi:cell wall-associated NlpC family hydrolase
MLKVDHLQGIPFEHGVNDCYTLVQRFYKDNYGLVLADYPHDSKWWDEGKNLYMENFYKEGFDVVDEHPTFWRPGDAFLLAIQSTVANHAVILLENGQILHHLWNRLSRVEPFAGWRNFIVAHLRHPSVVNASDQSERTNILDLLSPAKRAQFEAALALQRGRA